MKTVIDNEKLDAAMLALTDICRELGAERVVGERAWRLPGRDQGRGRPGLRHGAHGERERAPDRSRLEPDAVARHRHPGHAASQGRVAMSTHISFRHTTRCHCCGRRDVELRLDTSTLWRVLEVL